MGKQELSSTTTITFAGYSEPTKPMSLMEILHRTMKIFARSSNFMFSLFLLSLLPFSLLFAANNSGATPVIEDLVTNLFRLPNVDPKSPEFMNLLSSIMEDAREYMGVEALTTAFSAVISWLLMVSTVYATAVSYSSKEIVTLKDLFLWVTRNWKGPLVTQLYATLLSSGYVLLLAAVLVVVAFVSNGSSVLLAMDVTLFFIGLVFYMYLAAVLYMALATSVVEKGCYGLEALGRASLLVNGRKKQAVIISLVSWIAIVVDISVLSWASASLPTTEIGVLVRGVVMMGGIVVLCMFLYGTFTVFYCNCVECQEEQKMEGWKEGVEYTKLLAVDTELP